MLKKESDFPVTITGKVQKYRIREMAERELGLLKSDDVKLVEWSKCTKARIRVNNLGREFEIQAIEWNWDTN